MKCLTGRCRNGKDTIAVNVAEFIAKAHHPYPAAAVFAYRVYIVRCQSLFSGVRLYSGAIIAGCTFVCTYPYVVPAIGADTVHVVRWQAVLYSKDIERVGLAAATYSRVHAKQAEQTDVQEATLTPCLIEDNC